jgi:hypothetical protein
MWAGIGSDPKNDIEVAPYKWGFNIVSVGEKAKVLVLSIKYRRKGFNGSPN